MIWRCKEIRNEELTRVDGRKENTFRPFYKDLLSLSN
jgi:hypothetical protein